MFRLLVVMTAVLRPGVAADAPPDVKRLADLTGVWRADFNADASRIVVEMRSGCLGVWDARSGLPVAGDLGSLRERGSYVVDPTSTRVLVALASGKSRVFEMATAAAVSPELDLTFDGSWATCVVFTPDGTRLVVLKDGTCRVLDLTSGGEVARFPVVTAAGDDRETRPEVAFSKDGRIAMILDANAVLRRYDAHSWQPLAKPMAHPAEDCYRAGFSISSDAKFAVTFDFPGENGPSGFLQLWDAEAGESIAMPLSAVNGMAGEFIDGGRKLMIQPGRGRTRVVDLPGFTTALELPLHDDVEASRVVITGDGRQLLTWGYDHRLTATDATTGHSRHYNTHRALITDVIQGPDPGSVWLAIDNTSFFQHRHFDYYLFRLRLADLQPVATLRLTDYLHRYQLSPDGKCLMLHLGGTDRERIRLFDALSLSELPVTAGGR